MAGAWNRNEGSTIMSETIKHIRESGDSVFAALTAKAEAFGAHLALSTQQAKERLERQKQAVDDALDDLQAGVQRQNDLAKDVKQNLVSEIDGAKAQIGRVTEAAAGAGRAQIDNALARFEAAFDAQVAHSGKALDAATDTVLRSYVKAREALDAELEAFAAHAKVQAAYQDEAFDQRKRELGERFTAIKQQVEEQRSKYAGRLQEFEGEWKQAAEHVLGAFRKLFD
jgi:hypothetical protein